MLVITMSYAHVQDTYTSESAKEQATEALDADPQRLNGTNMH